MTSGPKPGAGDNCGRVGHRRLDVHSARAQAGRQPWWRLRAADSSEHIDCHARYPIPPAPRFSKAKQQPTPTRQSERLKDSPFRHVQTTSRTGSKQARVRALAARQDEIASQKKRHASRQTIAPVVTAAAAKTQSSSSDCCRGSQVEATSAQRA